MTKVDVLMVGAGEYTTGWVNHSVGAASDKPAGVIALCMIDLRRRGIVNNLSLTDAVGVRFPRVLENIQNKIGRVYNDMNCDIVCYPDETVEFDPNAYKTAIDRMSAGDMCTIFTPDDTHFAIAEYAIKKGLHVLLAKPPVKTLDELQRLIALAKDHGVLCAVEFHKRFDPIYTDAKDRIRNLGDFSFFSSTMTQAKQQLDTFAAWAGKSSDISYYLNSHHIDFHCWSVAHSSRPTTVTALASRGVAEARLQRAPIEDTIAISAQWENAGGGSRGVANYMASWAAPKADCHTQQYFHYMGHKGEVRADQAHRGYSTSTDATGFATLNPLYMKYTPNENGDFAGQHGYGYRSIEEFVLAVARIKAGKACPADFDRTSIAGIHTLPVQYGIAILEAGRLSLDNNAPVDIEYAEDGVTPAGLRVRQ